MRNAIFMVAALVGLAACAKDGAIETQNVSFKIGGVQTGDMLTKGATITAALEETLPSSDIDLTLTPLDGQLENPMVVHVGEDVEIPVGRYNVTGSYTPTKYSQSGNWYYMTTPSYVIDREVTIVRGEDQYNVQAEFNCWALVQDMVKVASMKKGNVFLSCAVLGLYGVVYVPEGAGNWNLTLVPEDEGLHQETTVGIVGNSMQNGKWYCYNPDGAVFEGALWINFPEWVSAN